MLKVIKQSLITSELINEIIEIKSVAWKYSYQNHLNWINQNIKEDDVHFLVFDNDELIAYLNLVNVNLLVDENSFPLVGIGNVCTKYPGLGHGRLLFNHLNSYLLNKNLEGLLFCKESLVKFYEKLGWTLFESLHPNKTIKTLSFNYTYKEGIIDYNDRLF